MSSRLSSLERCDARIQLHLHFVDFLVSLFLYHACRFFGDFSSAQEPLYLTGLRFQLLLHLLELLLHRVHVTLQFYILSSS